MVTAGTYSIGHATAAEMSPGIMEKANLVLGCCSHLLAGVEEHVLSNEDSCNAASSWLEMA